MMSKNFAVHIKAGECLLPEYNTRLNDDGSMQTFIPSEAGQAFEIAYENYTGHDLTCDIHFDGIYLSTYIVYARHPVRTIRKVRIGSDVFRTFKFAALEVFNDDTAAEQRGRILKTVGAIEVHLCRATIKNTPSHEQWTNSVAEVFEKPTLVHEKEKKDGRHSVAFGETVIGKASKIKKRYRRLDRRESPYLQFRWQYLPRDILQVQGIMPVEILPQNAGSQSAPLLPAKPTTHVATGDGGSNVKQCKAELDELMMQRALLDAKIQEAQVRCGVKKELSPDSCDAKRKSSPIRVPKGTVNQVIDLTLD